MEKGEVARLREEHIVLLYLEIFSLNFKKANTTAVIPPSAIEN